VKQRFADLPGWEFEVREMSVGWYRVVGRDADGREAALEGVELGELIERCRAEARQIDRAKLPPQRR
jgi:hypothetical protein